MKIAISGKGGVGKTTLSASLIHIFSKEKKRVVGIDADSFPNLAKTIGFSESEIKPISEMKELIQQRTYMGENGLYKLNPEVSDILEKYSLKKSNIRLLVLGTIQKGGSGCFCPESTFLKSLLNHILFSEEDIVILDMEAGLEHLGRGTAKSMDFMIVVVTPDYRSIEIAFKIKDLWKDISNKPLLVAGNMISDESDKKFVMSNLASYDIIGFLPYNREMQKKASEQNVPLFTDDILKSVEEIKKGIIKRYQ